jgi:hypothetical protein
MRSDDLIRFQRDVMAMGMRAEQAPEPVADSEKPAFDVDAYVAERNAQTYGWLGSRMDAARKRARFQIDPRSGNFNPHRDWHPGMRPGHRTSRGG